LTFPQLGLSRPLDQVRDQHHHAGLQFPPISLSHIGYFFRGVFQIVGRHAARAQTLGSLLGPEVEVGIVE
jgi:hypothetical protein